MEVTALCFTLVTTVMILLCDHDQTVDAVSLRIDPNRLQFFEYESLTFYCEGDFCYEVKHRSAMETSTCKKTSQTPSVCYITNVFPEDSGEYWCEAEEGERSKSVNISVTGGSVILESPARPVMEGDDVTLLCRNKTNSYNLTADFYKDGNMIGSSSTGEMIITSVSGFDEGLYKCSISGGGESAESWLTVRGPNQTSSSSSSSSSSVSTPWIIVTILLVVVVLILGFCHFYSQYQASFFMFTLTRGRNSVVVSTEPVLVPGASGPDANRVTAVERQEGDDSRGLVPPAQNGLSSRAVYYMFDGSDTQQLAQPGVSDVSAHSDASAAYSLLTGMDYYATVNKATAQTKK